jgi:hypothetical protein
MAVMFVYLWVDRDMRFCFVRVFRCREVEASEARQNSIWSRYLSSSILGDFRGLLPPVWPKKLGAFAIAGGAKWKKGDRERDHSRDASAKGSGLKSGRHSSGGSGRSGGGERKNKTKPKQKLAQLSTSGNVLGRVVEPFSSPAAQAQEPPEPASEKKTQHPSRNVAPQLTVDAGLPALPGLDDILDVPGGLDGQGNDISSWFTDGLDDSLQDIDLSGALEIPDDDLTQLGFIWEGSTCCLLCAYMFFFWVLT